MESRISLTRLADDIAKALKAYHQANGDPGPFAGLRILQQGLDEGAGSRREASNIILVNLVERLRKEDKEGAALLSQRFFDAEKMEAVANSLNMSLATAYRRKDEAIERLAALLYAAEIEARHKQQAVLEKRLDRPTYSQLIGVEPHVDQLLELLNRPGPPWLISIEGYGGVGKTSLAHALALQAIHQRLCDDLAWVSARQRLFKLSGQPQPVEAPALTTEDLAEKLAAQLMPQFTNLDRVSGQEIHNVLQRRLKQNPCWVVIDNLETLEDLEELLPALVALANPSKFLLTSRMRLDAGAAVYHFLLPELSEADTLKLIHHEIEYHNLSHLRQAGQEDLKKVYRVVGGNPLAIRLVMGQTHVFGLETILNDLRQAHSQTVEALYTFIYWRAWHALDQPTRRLFLAMPLISDEGEGLEALAELSGMEMATLHTSLKQLVDLNLVNSLGDHNDRYYNVHNLTRSFLEEQVLKWKS